MLFLYVSYFCLHPFVHINSKYPPIVGVGQYFIQFEIESALLSSLLPRTGLIFHIVQPLGSHLITFLQFLIILKSGTAPTTFSHDETSLEHGGTRFKFVRTLFFPFQKQLFNLFKYSVKNVSYFCLQPFVHINLYRPNVDVHEKRG